MMMKFKKKEKISNVFNYDNEDDIDNNDNNNNIDNNEMEVDDLIDDNDNNIIKSAKLREQGCNYAENREYSLAIKCFNDGLILTPQCHLLHELKAQVYLQLEQYLKAAESAKYSVELQPNFADGFITLARIYRELGEVKNSVECYRTAKSLDSNSTIDIIDEIKEMENMILKLESIQLHQMSNISSLSHPNDIEAMTCICNLTNRATVINK
jgi:tetratricopeptide (TPR) repeat protein